MPMMDRLTEEAHATGAVDTVTREGTRLIGHNTDVPGFRKALDALVGKQKMPKAAVVLGAGGGARAVVHALITAGFQHVIVFNRHLHRAEALVRHFGRSASHMELRAKPWHESVLEAELARTKLLVNASSVGPRPGRDAHPGGAPAARPAGPGPAVHAPRDAPAARGRRGRRGTVQNGDIMLIHQSAAAFELWTGQAAPLDLLSEHARRGPRQRSRGAAAAETAAA